MIVSFVFVVLVLVLVVASVCLCLMLESTAEIGNMKDDEEFEMLLDEIPHATSHNHHHHQHERKNHVNGSLHGMYGNGFMYDDDPSSSYIIVHAFPL